MDTSTYQEETAEKEVLEKVRRDRLHNLPSELVQMDDKNRI